MNGIFAWCFHLTTCLPWSVSLAWCMRTTCGGLKAFPGECKNYKCIFNPLLSIFVLYCCIFVYLLMCFCVVFAAKLVSVICLKGIKAPSQTSTVILMCFCVCSKAGISDMFEGHQGPITGINCHTAPGQIDFSPYFITSSFDWTVKLWNIKVNMTSVFVCRALAVHFNSFRLWCN